MPAFHLHILGDPVILGPAGAIAGRATHKRRMALLAILAVARGRPVGRERLLGLLWPELPTEAARHNLSESLYVLRKDLGEGVLAVGAEVALALDVMAADVDAFEAALEAGDAEGAARLYRGPLLDGFYVADAPEFERWAEGERERLARLHARAVERLAEAAEAEGSAIRAVDWWRRLSAHDPFSSRIALRLVRALDAAGERPSALRHAEVHTALLREELEVEPDPDFRAFVRLLRDDGAPRDTAPPPPLPRFAPPASPLIFSPGPPHPDAESRRAAPGDREASAAVSPAADGPGVNGDSRTAAAAEPARQDPADAGGAGAVAAAVPGAAADRALTAAATVVPSSGLAVAAGGVSAEPGGGAGTAAATGDSGTASSGGGGEIGGVPVRDGDGGGDRAPSPGSGAPIFPGDDGMAAVQGATPSPARAARPAGAGLPAGAGENAARVPGRRRWDPRALAYEAGLAGVVIGMLLSVLAAGWDGRGENAAPRYDPRRIAVLYFDDLSPHGELQYLANGLTDMLIHTLSQVAALDVVSRGGVKPYRDRAVRFDSMVADLRAGSVVEGSVQRSRDSVFVTVVLVDATTRAHLESRQVARPAGDVVELERALAEEVAASLRRRLGAEVRLGQVRRETRSARAAELVLRAEQLREDARRLAASQAGPDVQSAVRTLRQADSLLARAQDQDPGWARPPVLRGWVALSLAARVGGRERAELLAAAAGQAARVLRREPGNAAALELRGAAGLRAATDAGGAASGPGLDAAEHDLRAAVAADPHLATAWSTLSLLLRMRGRFAESDLTARRALAEDAYLDDAAAIRQRLVFSAMSAGNYPLARDECARGHAQFPVDWRFVECRLTLLRQDASQQPDVALAWRLVAELDRLDPPEVARAAGRGYSPLYRRMVAAAISARAGDADSARAVLARARALAATPDLRLSLDYDEAVLRVQLGERDAARAVLARLLAARPWLQPYLARDPLLRGAVTPSAPAPPPTRPG
ncbi:MAG TPA: BTAD domain-containing putative transcriptional regulator [Longimicrobium sp.]|nr:BTAD domain-containing putative transcriptional regulator [Longimicrobium sp.]